MSLQELSFTSRSEQRRSERMLMNKDRVGVALIGCGRAGLIHGQNFAFTCQVHILHVVDPVEENAKGIDIAVSQVLY